MKFSRACGYAIQAIVLLARRKPERLLASHLIAREEGLPERYLVKVLKPLAQAGILYSLRGPAGGFRLARPARAISLLDVIEAVDGPIRGEVPPTRVEVGRRLDGQLQETCVRAAETTRQRLRRVSVADLAGKAR